MLVPALFITTERLKQPTSFAEGGEHHPAEAIDFRQGYHFPPKPILYAQGLCRFREAGVMASCN
jgi:hypothetical protein